MKKTTTGQRRYKVALAIAGEVNRIVAAPSEEEAVSIAKKMLLEADGQTPKKNALAAFCWDFNHGWAFPHWADMPPEERKERVERLKKNNDEQTTGEYHDD